MGQYLFKRIAQLGVEHIFGVPGDFNRKFVACFIILSLFMLPYTGK